MVVQKEIFSYATISKVITVGNGAEDGRSARAAKHCWVSCMRLHALCHAGSIVSVYHDGTSVVMPVERMGILQLLPVCQNRLNMVVLLLCGALVAMTQIASIVFWKHQQRHSKVYSEQPP